MPAKRYSTWPTPGYVPIGLSVGGKTGTGGDVVRVERVRYGKGPIAERRPGYGVPEGNIACTVLTDGAARTYDIYEHHMTEQRVRYKVQFEVFPDIEARDRLIWINAWGTGIEKVLTVLAVVWDNGTKGAYWMAHCEEHTA